MVTSPLVTMVMHLLPCLDSADVIELRLEAKESVLATPISLVPVFPAVISSYIGSLVMSSCIDDIIADPVSLGDDTVPSIDVCKMYMYYMLHGYMYHTIIIHVSHHHY